MKTYCVYILTNKPRGTLYVGVTGELQRRILEHKQGTIEGFTKKYHLKKLVYVEAYDYVYDALHREKKLKRFNRALKIHLIEEQNPDWHDLYELYFEHKE